MTPHLKMDNDEGPDLTDDWMNPQSHFSTYTPKERTETEYLIERQRRIICFGDPGSIIEWGFWASFKTAEERNAELHQLMMKHPLWLLRARDRHPWDYLITA